MRPLVVVVGVLVAACSDNGSGGDLGDCDPVRPCPTGFVCRELDHTCVLANGAIDAGGRISDAPPPDARLPDAPPGAAPDTTITSGPLPLDSLTPVTFTFTATITPATFECSLDSAAFTACVSPFTFPVADGVHRFAVRAIANRQTDPTPATQDFTVDTTPPETTITSGPSGDTPTNAASFTFVASETGATFTCALDRGPFTPCVPGVTYRGLGLGNHRFAVAASDALGNTDPTPATQDWNVTQVIPSTTILTGPEPLVASASATFTFTSDQPAASFTCSIDGGPFTACASPQTYDGLGEGQHTFTVAATLAGLVDPVPPTWTWAIDLTGPVAKISGGVSASIACPDLHFQYTTEPQEGDARFICALVAGAGPAAPMDYAPCSINGESYPGLLDNTRYTFSVIAIDPLGNQGPADSVGFTMDAAGPQIHILSPTANAGQSFTVNFSATDALTATYQCEVSGTGGSQVVDCLSGQLFTGVAAGAHTISVTGTDACGNVASAGLDIEVVIPTTIGVSQPCGEITGPRGSIIYSTGKAVTVHCKLDGDDVGCSTDGNMVVDYDYADTAGADLTRHTFEIIGLDADGNVVGDATCSWRVDVSGPALTPSIPNNPLAGHDLPPGMSAPPNSVFVCPSPRLAFICEPSYPDDLEDCPAAAVECGLDGKAPTVEACAGALFSPAFASAGKHQLTLIGEDAFVNVGPPGTEVFYVDDLGPIFGLSIPHPATWGPGDYPWVAVPGPVGPSGFAGASGESGASGRLVIAYGDLNPALDHLAPIAGNCVIVGASGPTGACVITGGPTGTTIQLGFSGLADANNPYTATVTLADSCGNPTTHSITWVVDSTPPDVVFTSVGPTFPSPMGPSGSLVVATCPSGAVQWVTVPPEYPGAAVFECALNGGDLTVGNCVPAGPSGGSGSVVYGDLPSGLASVSVEGIDEWGNSSVADISWLVDHTAPALAFAPLATGASGSFLGLVCGSTGAIAWNTFGPEPATTQFGCVYGPTGATGATCTTVSATGATLTNLAYGLNTISVTPTDACGNAQTYTASFFAEPSGPTGATGVTLANNAGTTANPVACGATGATGATVVLGYGFQTSDPNPLVTCELRVGGPSGALAPSGSCGPTGAVYTGVASGVYSFKATITDSCNNSASQSLLFWVENGNPTAPTGLMLTGVTGGFECTQTAQLFSFVRDLGLPVDSTFYTCGPSGALAGCQGGTGAVPYLAEGAYTEVAQVTNACGRTASASLSVTYDTLAPSPGGITLGGATGTVAQPVVCGPTGGGAVAIGYTFTNLDATDDVVSCVLRLGGPTGATGPTGTCGATGVTFASLGSGSYNLTATTTDFCHGTVSQNQTFWVENGFPLAPTGLFITGASGGSGTAFECLSSAQTFSFSRPLNAPFTSYTCGASGSTLASCPGGTGIVNYPGEGSFTELARVTDACGRSATASTGVVYDTLAPAPSGISVSGATGTVAQPVVCGPTGGGAVALGYTFANLDATDDVVSCVLRVGGPTGATGPTGTCGATGVTFASLGNGSYNLTATTTDFCHGTVSQNQTFWVENGFPLAPTGLFITGASGGSGTAFECLSSAQTFSFSRPLGAPFTSYTCGASGSVLASCPGGTGIVNYPGEGSFTELARVTDACGRSATASTGVVYDTIAPAPSGITVSGATGTVAQPVFCAPTGGGAVALGYTFANLDATDDVVSCVLRLGGPTGATGPTGACGATGVTFASLGNGTYNLTATTTDFCHGTISQNQTFWVEAGFPLAPTGLFITGATGVTGAALECASASQTFSFSRPLTAPFTSYTCGASGSVLASCPGGTGIVSYPGEGAFTELARVTDACNRSATAATGVVYDTIAPVITLTGPVPAYSSGVIYTSEAPHFSLAVASTGSPASAPPRVNCTLVPTAFVGGGGIQSPITVCPGPTGATGYTNLSDLAGPSGNNDPYTLTVTAIDACNRGVTGATSFTVDSQGPSGKILTPASGAWVGPSAATGAFNFLVTDNYAGHTNGSGIAAVTGLYDGHSISATGSFMLPGATADGTHSISLTTTDHVGHLLALLTTWGVDAVAPQITGLTCVKAVGTICDDGGPVTRQAHHSYLVQDQQAPLCPDLACVPDVSAAMSCSFTVDATDHLGAAGHDDGFSCTCALNNHPFNCTPASAKQTQTFAENELAVGDNLFTVACSDHYGNSSSASFTYTQALGIGHVFLIGSDGFSNDNQIDIVLEDAAQFSWAWHNYCVNSPYVRGFALPTVNAVQHDAVLQDLADAYDRGGSWFLGDWKPATLAQATAAELANQLVGADVLLIYDQRTGDDTMEILGARWKTVLQRFVAYGGEIIVLDGVSGATGATTGFGETPSRTYELLDPNGADLFLGLEAGGAQAVNGSVQLQTLVSDYADRASFDDVTLSPFFAQGTVAYNDDVDDPVLYSLYDYGCARLAGSVGGCTTIGDPVMLHQQFDIGCGYDYTVDAKTGSDSNAGTCFAPFKTITHALAVAGSGPISAPHIKVRPGFYDSASNGETFPLKVPARTCLVGDPATYGEGRCVQIVNSRQTYDCSDFQTTIMADPMLSERLAVQGVGPSGEIEGFIITAPGSLIGPTGVALISSIGVHNVQNASSFGIRCNQIDNFDTGVLLDVGATGNQVVADFFQDNQTAVAIGNGSGHLVQLCQIANQEGGVFGVMLGAGAANPTIAYNSITGYGDGIHIEGGGGALILGNDVYYNNVGLHGVSGATGITVRNNGFVSNSDGVILGAGVYELDGNVIDHNYYHGVVLFGSVLADLGGGPYGSPGGNTFTCNGDFDRNNTGDVFATLNYTLYMQYDAWDDPGQVRGVSTQNNCIGGVDICTSVYEAFNASPYLPTPPNACPFNLLDRPRK